MQLGSDSVHSSFVSGIAPVQSDSPGSLVQSTSPTAVGGPSRVDSSSRQCTFLGRHLITVAPNSSSVLPSAACAASAPVPATSAHLGLMPGPTSLQHLPAATGRPPGSTPDAAFSPGLPCASPALASVPVSSVQLGLGPSKRRLSFPLWPKLAKRFKFG